jgi:hypothetical protein
MIKKTILTAAIMLVAYHVVFPHLPREYSQQSGPQRDNYFRAQRYVHETPPGTKVIVGSSLSLRFNEAALGSGYYKLCLGGGSIFTGLEIVRRADKHPRAVLVEINQLVWNKDEELLHDLFVPWQKRLRSFSAIFKEEGRPANFINGIAQRAVVATCGWGSYLLHRAPSPDIPPASGFLHPVLFARLLRMYHDEALATAPPDLTVRANRLGEAIDALSRDGVICVLYEMPIDSSLSDRPSPVAVRNAMAIRFPKTKYHWLEFPHDHDYKTYDGLHATQAEADRLTNLLIPEIDRISRN